MFDVGFTELLLIGIVSLIVIGPERLPAVARTAGQWIGKLQRFVRGVKTDLASELESGDLKKLIGDQREQINELKDMVNSAKKDFQSSTKEAVEGAKKSFKEMESTMKDAEDDAQRRDGDSALSEQSRVDSKKPNKSVASVNQNDSASSNKQGLGTVPDAQTPRHGDSGVQAANSDAGEPGGMDRTGTELGK